jgi:hypothetical protein
MDGKSILHLVSEFYERLWNAWDDEVVGPTLAPGFTFRGSLGQRTSGRDGWRAYRDLIRTGRRFTYAGAAFLTADGGLLTDAWVLGDLAGLRAQLT